MSLVLMPPPANDPRPITGEGCDHDVGPDLRDHMAVFTDGRVFVSDAVEAGSALAAEIEAVLAKLRAANVPLRDAETFPAHRIPLFYRARDAGGRHTSPAAARPGGRPGTSALEHGGADATAKAEVLALLERTRGRNVSDILLTCPNDPNAAGEIAFVIHGDAEPLLPAPAGPIVARYIHALWALCSADLGGAGFVSAETLSAERYPRFAFHGSPLPTHLSSIRGQVLSGTGRAVRVVVRLVPALDQAGLPTLDDLLYTPEEQRQLMALTRQSTGALFISGPVGHGKTTLAFTLFEKTYRLRQEHGRSPVPYTLESPPEREISFAHQLDARDADEWLEAASALVRSASTMLLYGEIKDEAEVHALFRLTASSIPVMTTIHANSPWAIHTKLRHMGVSNDTLTDPSQFAGYVAQRLVPRLCPHCSEPYTAASDDDLTPVIEKLGLMGFAKRRGHRRTAECSPDCHKGVIARLPLIEIVRVDAPMLARLNTSLIEAETHWAAAGGVSIAQKALDLVRAGHLDPFDAMLAADIEAVVPARPKPRVVQ